MEERRRRRRDEAPLHLEPKATKMKTLSLSLSFLVRAGGWRGEVAPPPDPAGELHHHLRQAHLAVIEEPLCVRLREKEHV
jgi:hypothetical protein